MEIGTTIGAYQVIGKLGEGGMGEVYRARDTRLKRDIAVKVLPDVWVADRDRVARFQREAEVLATLNHPNIAAIYGVEEAEGIHAIVLELVEGPTIADRLNQGPIPITEALSIARQIADALDAAHERGIVHRDLKPANIKLRDDGVVKVLDFGLAKAVEGTAGAGGDLTDSPTLTSPAITRQGVILGTAAYMSPEQTRGKVVDKRTDIWAFGCVLYEMLAARAVFAGPTLSDTIAAILERHPDWTALPATTPPAIRHLIERCLERDHKRRLRDIGDARSDLDRVEARADPPLAIVRPGTLRWLSLGAALAAAAAAGFVWHGAAGRSASSSPFGPELTRLSSDASLSTEPALSRDGTMVVYASDRDGVGQLDLWLQRTAGGPPLRLTDDPADDREPDLSPDGSFITFQSDRKPGGVYVMPVLGGNARLVAPGGRAPRYSPDGSRIAYSVPDNWLAGARNTPSALYVVAATGGPATRIAQRLASAAFPHWSPDGRSLLFFGRTAASSSEVDWWWVAIDGETPVATGAYEVIERAGLSGSHGNDPDVLPAAWTKDGVLFSARFGDSVNVWRLQISERSGEAAGTTLKRLTFGPGADVRPSADNQGRIAFQVASDVGESLTLPLDPNSGAVTGSVTVQSSEAGEAPGRSSLDDSGRWLAYPRSRGTELWVKDLSSGRERHVVTVPTVANPIISHDGTNVAYGDGEGARSSGYVIAVAGGTARKICDGCSVHGWFSDNRRILAFEWDAPASKGRVRAIDTRDLTRLDLIQTTARVGRVDLSPTERWLVFAHGGRSLMTRVQPGSPPPEREWVTVFERASGSAERPCGWSPDGRLLYLLLERDGFRDLYAQRIDAAAGARVGEPFLVKHFHDPRRRWGSTAFGSAIVSNAFVFTQVETSGSIWLLKPE